MGAVTARAAGVDEVVVAAPAHPVILAAAALCGADEVYAMGGAQAIAALALGTESVPRVDVIVGPGNLYVQEAKRQLSGVVGIDGFAGPSDLCVILSAGADPAWAAADLRAQAEHGPDSLVVAVSDDPDLLPAEGVGVEAADLEAALAFAEALAPEHLQLMGAAAEALAPRVRRAGCLFVGNHSGTAFGDYVAGSNHTLPTEGAARFASGLSAPPLPPPHGRGPHPRRRRGEARPGRRRDRARGGLRGPRRVDGGKTGESRAMTRTSEVSRKTGETDVTLSLGLDGSGAGTRRPASASSTTCSTCSPATAGSTSRCRSRATSRPARTTRSRTPASCSARRSTARSATAPGSPATATPWSRWTRRARPARSTSPGRPFCAWSGLTLPPGDIAGFEHEAAEEFFRAVASAARLTLHLELQAGTNAHHMIEACFKAFARALRAAVAVDPSETGVPSTKGTLT